MSVRKQAIEMGLPTPFSELVWWMCSWVESLMSAIVAVMIETGAAADGCRMCDLDEL